MKVNFQVSRMYVFLLVTLAVFSQTGLAASPAAAKPRHLIMSRAEYLDRVKAIWTAQMIGQWTGVQFEHQVASALKDTPLRPGGGFAPVDDDYYYGWWPSGPLRDMALISRWSN